MATTATSKPGLDGLLIFEQPFARVRLVPLFSTVSDPLSGSI
jgi:hypothetical protein